MTDDRRTPAPRSLARALLVPALTAALLAALLILWIRAEPFDLTRGPQVALASGVAAVFGAILIAAHRAGA